MFQRFFAVVLLFALTAVAEEPATSFTNPHLEALRTQALVMKKHQTIGEVIALKTSRALDGLGGSSILKALAELYEIETHAINLLGVDKNSDFRRGAVRFLKEKAQFGEGGQPTKAQLTQDYAKFDSLLSAVLKDDRISLYFYLGDLDEGSDSTPNFIALLDLTKNSRNELLIITSVRHN